MTTFIMDFGDGTLSLGGTDHICQVMSAVLAGSNTRQDITTGCGTTTRFINERFELQVRFVQDFRTGGISKYLWDHYNTDVAFVFSPAADNTPSVAGTLTCPRPKLGGDAGTPCIDDLTMPCVGTPTLTGDA